MHDAAKRKIDVILCWKLDRFGRSLLHCKTALQELQAYGVRFIATSQNTDTDESNPAARFLLHISWLEVLVEPMGIIKAPRLALLVLAFLLVVGILLYVPLPSVTRIIPENRTYVIGWEEDSPDQQPAWRSQLGAPREKQGHTGTSVTR